MAIKVEIEVAGKLKFIGMMEGGTLELQRSRGRHFYRKLNAYGMDRELANKLFMELDCREIRIHEMETDDYYTVDMETFIKKSLPNQYGQHGAQLFLPLRYWTKS